MATSDVKPETNAPIIDRPARSGNIAIVTLLAAVLVGVAIMFALMRREAAEPYVLGFLALLAVIGVFSLFAGAVGLIRFGGTSVRDDRTKALVDSMTEGVLLTGEDGRILYANRAYGELVGAETVRELRTVERLFSHEPDVAEVVYRLSLAAREGRRAQEEVRLSHPLGGAEGEAAAAGAHWYRVRVRPLENAGQGGRMTVWQIADITRDRQRQENIFLELQNAIDYLDHAPAGFFSADPSGRIVYLNATLADWLGHDLARFERGAISISDIVSGDGAALLTGFSGTSGTRELRTETIDLDLVKRNGQHLPVRLLHRVPVSGDGRLGASRTLVLNRSPGEEVSEELRAAEVRFARFFNNTPIAIAGIERDGRIGRSNAPFLRMFGDLCRGDGAMKLTDIVAEEDRAALEGALAAARRGQSEIPPVDVHLAGEGERSARCFISGVQDGEGDDEIAIVYVLETTEQRALEAQFAQSQKMQAIGQLAGGVAHDFNNVLTAIIGFSDLLLANHRPSDPSFPDIMNIKQSANRAAGLVKQLLAFSRRQTLRPEVLALGDVLSELTNILDRLLGEKISLEMIHGRDLWPVKLDENQFELVVINLGVNARDAMPEGGTLTIRTSNVEAARAAEFRYKGLPAEDFVLCEISDTGTGMTPEVMEKIFEPFFTTKDIGKGTGLGLSTVYGIIKQTGGFIYPESTPGRGTTFRIFLPRHVAEVEEVDETVEKTESGPVDLTGTATILLVEDEETVRTFTARALASRGYDVHEAATGAEALDVMKSLEGRVDLVISDVVMPEMDGPTLLKELRRQRPDLKIIFMSGYAEDAFARHLGGDEQFTFLPKPFSLKKVAEAVKKTLAG